MARRAVHRLGRTRGGAVALAVIDRAQMRATFQHLAADLRPVRRLVALADLAAAGLVDRAACPAFVVRRPRHRIPVSCPFPAIPDPDRKSQRPNSSPYCATTFPSS